MSYVNLVQNTEEDMFLLSLSIHKQFNIEISSGVTKKIIRKSHESLLIQNNKTKPVKKNKKNVRENVDVSFNTSIQSSVFEDTDSSVVFWNPLQTSFAGQPSSKRSGNNLVYSAPTSAGKTMVAELLILKRVLETKRKAIMILPFVSVAHEKVRYLKSLYEEVGVRVGGFLGSQSPVGGFKSVDVAVCTIEKGNNLVNRLIEEKELHQLGIIVVDELHMVGDSSRGYLLELLLTKILYVLKCEIVRKSRSNQGNVLSLIQIIGMSATLPNLPVIAKWLNASLYKTEFRPVPLHECVKINRSIFDSDMNKLRDIDIQYSAKNDTEYVVPLCLETVFNGDGVLIFCPTKMWCEKLADTVAREFFNFLHKIGSANVEKNDLEHNCRTLPINKKAAYDVVEQLKRCPAGLDSILQKTIQCGVAFHHAGLTFDEREIVESAFRKGIIKVLIATSTLSSGVNLPARRVIIRTIMFHGKTIDTRTYKQMVGRAGRKGVDIEGESILICKANEKQQANALLKSSLPAVVSTLLRHPQDHLSTSMKRAILEIIVSGAARKPSDVYLYTKCTLLSACLEEEKEAGKAVTHDVDPVQECIQFLEENEFITLKKVPNADNEQELEFCFFPTQLGSAVLSSGLSPDEGIYVFLELQRARRCFVLENELHVLYLECGQQARILFSAGYVSVASLAKADSNHLEHILRAGVSFQSDKKTEDETEWEAKERLTNRRCIWLRGMPGMTAYEAALTMIEEAQQIIEQGLGSNEFTIIDVCSNRQLFDTFILEWNTQKKYALSIGCEKLLPVDPTLGIGGNFMEGQDLRIDADGLKVEEEGLLVVGIAICWNYRDSYYLSFKETNPADNLDDSLAPPTLDPGISIADRLHAVRQTLMSHNDDKRTIVGFDVKSLYRVLAHICSVAPRCHFEDPKIAAWMLNPGAKESNFQRLIYDYLPTEEHLLRGLGGGIGRSGLGLTVDNPGSGRYRATAESVLVWHLMKHLKRSLKEEGIFQTFQETEMPVVCIISRMELNGIGFSEEESIHLKTIMQLKLSSLEEKAYTLAGHPFSLSSIDDISKVLYLELQLPVNGNPNAITPAMPRKTLGTKRGSKKAMIYFPPMNMHRIFGLCQLHTATGRISMFDPNLQNIPKDFNINITDVSQESAVIHSQWLKKNSSDSFTVSMRHAFIPLPDGVIIAADYSQLELRMIAHLSQDSKLINILNKDCDVFRLIAAEWKNVSLEEVQNEERQQAKQICYGIIYGIGAKALGETLHVDENDAAVFIETFKSKYPGMKSYLRHLVEYCRDKGYIQTITGRKRYLPHITSTNIHAKAQAERQAVNSTIQGSAADLVKKAMINIENEFVRVFPQSSVPHRIYSQAFQSKVDQRRYFQQMKLFPEESVNCRSGAFLLLQIHDELLYEVAKKNLKTAAAIIQKGMESAMTLSVHLPVKLKCGHSWGQLEDFILE
ncbi:POLQ [Acanthosepion pharaonis]|uniref:DNA-directed DNA polymerase n=1 Tax=Acanthosepion pharaonis TaxID=158019 RepID=A0A812DIF6_ACAPH|nr:POLQ [Sepia pharaonis]